MGATQEIGGALHRHAIVLNFNQERVVKMKAAQGTSPYADANPRAVAFSETRRSSARIASSGNASVNASAVAR